MKLLSGTVNHVYPLLIQSIMREGANVPSRNGLTKELHPCVLELHNTRDRLVTSYGRPVNVAFALAEVLWILAGRSDVEMLKFYNRRIDTWSDDGATFNAPYGHRLRAAHGHDQLDDVIRTLRQDINSRQAVLNVWHPPSDRGWTRDNRNPNPGKHWVQHQTADRACNMLSHLMVRNGALDWMHIVRSNDAIWGVPYNFMQWMHLQEYVASMVGVPVGKFFHMVDSMHIYAQMVPEPGNRGLPDLARWDEAAGIKYFDLYQLTGTHHQPMGATNKKMLDQIMFTELHLRKEDSVPSKVSQILAGLQIGNYWKSVLDVLYAHKLYIEGRDALALNQLINCGDPVLALAQVRFYMAMRWKKSDWSRDMVAAQIEALGDSTMLWSWLVGEQPF